MGSTFVTAASDWIDESLRDVASMFPDDGDMFRTASSKFLETEFAHVRPARVEANATLADGLRVQSPTVLPSPSSLAVDQLLRFHPTLTEAQLDLHAHRPAWKPFFMEKRDE